MKITAEDFGEFLISSTAKLLFLALLLMFIGSFLLNMYQSGNETVCDEVKEVLKHDLIIEKDLINNGHIKDAKLLHTSLVDLAKKADYCDESIIKKLLKGRK
jgi:hypothetical protein